MSHTFSRKELFDVVWSEPTRTVAKRLGISDVGLAKACRRAELLLPPRGYWARLAAGKTVSKPQLPPRGPGMSDRIVLGGERWGWGPDPVKLSTPDPPVPIFPETLEDLAARLFKQLGTIRRTRDLNGVHSRVQKLLDADEQRRTRQAASPYPTHDAPVFETSFEKRRLRLLNSLLRGLDRLDVSVSIDDREGSTLVAHVGDHSVSFTIDRVSSKPKTQSSPPNGTIGRMRCQLMALGRGDEPVESWTDVEGQTLETRLAEIAVAIVVHGERVCRSSALHYREWVIQRKGEIAEEQRRKDEERRRLERERLDRLEKTRVARLLAQAKALQDAQEIRAYVSAVRDTHATLEHALSETELQHWATWALAQADRIDPVLTGRFRTVQIDD
jgi:hypothetical protein